MSLPTLARVLALTLSALALAAGSAHAEALTPEDVATLVGDGKVAVDIKDPRVSPDGKHFTFLHDAHLRYENPPPYDTFAPTCFDVWVARADGSELTRLTKTCDYRGTYESRGGGGGWSPDGAVETWYSDYVKGSSGSTRWTVAVGTGGSDIWAANSYAGYGAGYTSDGRYWIVQFQRAVGSGHAVTAVDVATGVANAVWTTGYPGQERWSEACASAPAPASYQPTLAEIDAVLTGPEPACTFVPRTKPAEPEPEPVDPADAVVPTDAVPTSPLPATTQAESSAAPASLSPAGVVAPASTAPAGGQPLQLLAVTSSLRRALALGFTVKYSAPGATTVRVWILRGTSKIARGSVSSTDSGQLQLVSDRALRKVRLGIKPLVLTVRLAATDAKGRRTVLDRPLTLHQ